MFQIITFKIEKCTESSRGKDPIDFLLMKYKIKNSSITKQLTVLVLNTFSKSRKVQKVLLLLEEWNLNENSFNIGLSHNKTEFLETLCLLVC